MVFLHTEQNRFNILMKQEKNNAACPAVMRFILSCRREKLRKNCKADGFISCDNLEGNMGNSNTGNQRFVNAAYRYIEVNGRCGVHEIVNYIHGNLSSVISTEINAASSLLAIHPMFRSVGKTKHKGSKGSYDVAELDIVPEEVVVAKLALATHENKSLRFAFRKYPHFIKKQVNALLDSPNFNPDECLETIERYNEMISEEE